MSALEVITRVIQMQHVQTLKVLINVNVTVDILEMDTIVQVYLTVENGGEQTRGHLHQTYTINFHLIPYELYLCIKTGNSCNTIA